MKQQMMLLVILAISGLFISSVMISNIIPFTSYANFEEIHPRRLSHSPQTLRVYSNAPTHDGEKEHAFSCDISADYRCGTTLKIPNKLNITEVLPGASMRQKPNFYYTGLSDFVDYTENRRLACPQMKYKGGRRRDSGDNDGEKAVCLAPVFNITPGDCLVYSFGIGLSQDFSFDDAMAGYGCQVFSFDPTINLTKHKRSENVHFYDIGIWFNDTVRFIDGENRPFLTLGSIKDLLGHTNKIIDYLKLDVEGTELEVLQDLSSNPQQLLQIKQLGIEIHPMEYIHEDYYNLFVQLEYHGFTTFDTHKTRVKELWYNVTELPGRTLSQCYEMAWAQVDALYW